MKLVEIDFQQDKKLLSENAKSLREFENKKREYLNAINSNEQLKISIANVMIQIKTFTPFPTSTLLPAAGTLTCYSDNRSIFDCVQIDPYTVRWNFIGNPSTAPNITGQFEVQHPNQPVYVTAHWDEPSWVSIHGWQTNPEGRYGIIGLPSVYVNDGGHGAPCSFNPDKLCGSFAVGTWTFIQPAATNSFKRATVGFQIYPDPPATVH